MYVMTSYTYDTNYVPELVGFNNNGSICWLNALLQSLLSCSSINAKLSLADDTNEFQTEYKSLLKTSPLNPYFSSQVLTILVKHLRMVGSTLPLGLTQECAHEGFTCIMDAFGDAADSFHVEYETITYCDTCHCASDKHRDKSFNIEMFYDGIELNTPTNMIRFIHKHTTVCDEYYCETCKDTRKATRIETLKQLRDCIVLTFNKYYGKKLEWFPTTLQFSTFPKGNYLTYEQVAQIEHVGTMNGGHYYAIVRRNDKWYCVNDTSISPDNPGPTPNTYMVFYHLK